MLYQGSDGNIHVLGDAEELKHFKYIKKIKAGNGWRYFYTPEEVKAYYNASKAVTNVKYDFVDGMKKNRSEKRTENSRQKFEKQTQRDIERTRNKLMRGDITTDEAKREVSGLLKRTGKNAMKYGKESAKEQAKTAISENKNKVKRKVEPVTNTAKAMAKGEIPKQPKKKTATLKTNKKKKLSKTVSKSLSKARKESSKSINKGRSAVEKKLNKTKKTVKNEAKGVKRVTKAMQGKGNNFYDADGKHYSVYDKKKKKFGKSKKTGKAERTLLSAYRKTHPYE